MQLGGCPETHGETHGERETEKQRVKETATQRERHTETENFRERRAQVVARFRGLFWGNMMCTHVTTPVPILPIVGGVSASAQWEWEGTTGTVGLT